MLYLLWWKFAQRRNQKSPHQMLSFFNDHLISKLQHTQHSHNLQQKLSSTLLLARFSFTHHSPAISASLVCAFFFSSTSSHCASDANAAICRSLSKSLSTGSLFGANRLLVLLTRDGAAGTAAFAASWPLPEDSSDVRR